MSTDAINLIRKGLLATAGPSWLVGEVGSARVSVAVNNFLVTMGLKEPDVTQSDLRVMKEEILHEIRHFHDEELIRTLNSSLDLRPAVNNTLLNLKIAKLMEIAELEEGTTGGRPNNEVRCLAYLGMLAAFDKLTDYELTDGSNEKSRLLSDMLCRAIDADSTTAMKTLGEDAVNELLLGLTGLDKLAWKDTVQIPDHSVAAISPDGQTVATVDYHTINLWDIETGQTFSD